MKHSQLLIWEGFMLNLLAIVVALVLSAGSASAFEKLEGYFIAEQVCEAYQSKNKLTNPGEITTALSTAYVMKGLNKIAGDYFQIVVPGAPVTEDRWVSVDCGIHVVKADTAVASSDGDGDVVEPVAGDEASELLLALSWQPAFCEAKSSKKECKQLNSGLLPITETQLSIHGLWPQPDGKFYCGVPHSIKKLDKPATWHQLPAVELSAETRELLNVAMPGTASFLERHEWIKHGTCYFGAGGAEEYYQDILRVTDEINTSVVGEFLSAHLGTEVETSEIRTKFDAAFGEGAGARVQFRCAGDGNRVLIGELQINLRGVIGPNTPVSELLLAADEVSIGCKKGTIDPAGLQ
jgi:ribonuclease T2